MAGKNQVYPRGYSLERTMLFASPNYAYYRFIDEITKLGMLLFICETKYW